MLIGAHLSISRGYLAALERIVSLGGNCLQLFSSPPCNWSAPILSKETIRQFNNLRLRLGVEPVYFHAPYLINLADPIRIGHFSKKALIAELNLASRLGVKGSIVHLGSYKNEKLKIKEQKYRTLIANIKEILQGTPENVLFIIENAGMRKIGASLEEIAQIMKDVGGRRVRVCLDTCHLHAAGYDIKTHERLDGFLKEFDNKIGLDRLELWHLNDSKDPFGSFRDRHENIGQGYLGLDIFRLLLNHQLTSELPFIIETPGFDQEGPDKRNLETLKKLAEY